VTAATSAIARRLEAVPVGAFHRRFITLVSLGGWFDLYDLFMMAYIGAALQASHFLSLAQFTATISAGFAGMFIGTLFFGMGSDRMGRRTAFVAMLLIYSGFTFAGALAPSAAWLIAMRFFAGIGIGAEIVVIDTYVTELVPSSVRGRYVAITQVAGFTSVPVAALLARMLTPTHYLIDGWRWVTIFGAAGALLAWHLRLRLPESPRWLESRGRAAEAERIVADIELQSGLPSPAPQVRETRAAVAEAARFTELWQVPYRSRTIMLMLFQLLQTIGFYGFANWAPTYLLKRGIGLKLSLDYALLIALIAPLGPLIATATADRFERKWTVAVLALLIALFGMGFAVWSAPVLMVLSGALLTLSNNWFSATFHAYQSELFPTRVRATGVGFTYSWSRLSAAGTSFLIAAVLRHGVPAVFAMLAASMVAVAGIVAAMGPRTNRRTLEELNA
jgi:putative MFS transporter